MEQEANTFLYLLYLPSTPQSQTEVLDGNGADGDEFEEKLQVGILLLQIHQILHIWSLKRMHSDQM